VCRYQKNVRIQRVSKIPYDLMILNLNPEKTNRFVFLPLFALVLSLDNSYRPKHHEKEWLQIKLKKTANIADN